MTKAEKLYDLFQSLARDEIKEDYTVEYQRGDGWYLVPFTPKYYDDKGIFLGSNYQDAVQWMESREFYNIVG